MPAQLPYLASYKNLGKLFEKIASAKIPDKFSHSFLQTTIGLKSTNDRALIPLLRNLGFIDQSGTPTASYALLKGDKQRAVIAAGVRKAYAPLFDSDQNACQLPIEKLKSLVAQVAGTDSGMTGRIAQTFAALAKLGDFSATAPSKEDEKKPPKPLEEEEEEEEEDSVDRVRRPKGLRTEFHYNIHVQLPSNGTEETYLNIFNAIRKTFQ
jgi:hypothetical protein